MGDVIGEAKQTFSSWDSCMDKSYCKYPVIVAMIVGAVIVLSFLFCCIKCMCCAGECTCLCFKCLRGCCGSGRSGHKRVKSNPYMPPNQQYQSHPPAQMFPQAHHTPNPYTAPYAAAPVAASPQYAHFDTPSKPHNPDALPQHSTWNDAPKHHVLDDTPHDDVELKPLAAAPSPVHTPLAGNEYNPYGGSYASSPYRPDNNRQYSDPAYPGYQESGVDRGNEYGYGGQHTGTYSQRSGPPAYEDAYARGAPSPGGYSGTTYAQNSQQETGYQGDNNQGYESYQPARQGGWHTTRRPVNGSFREV